MGVAEVILKLEDQASAKLNKISKETKKLDKELRKAGKEVLTVAAGFAAAGIAAAVFIQKIADMQNEIRDMSVRTGVATDTLSTMRVMAEATGRQFEDLNEVINPLVARMGQVAAGNEAVGKQFADLGIKIVDANGKMVSTDAVLKDIMSTLRGIEDPTERASAAVALLGESGGKLVQILGAGEFDAFAQFVSKFGSDTGPKAAKAAAEWQVATALLSETVRGVLSEFAGIESATELVVQLAGAVAFVAESFKALLAFPGEFLSQLSQAMSQAFDLINTVAAKIRDALPDNILFANLRREIALIADVGAEGAFQFRQDPSEAQQFDPFAARAELIAGFRDVLTSAVGAPAGGGGGLPLAAATDAAEKAGKTAEKAAKEELSRQDKARAEMLKRVREWTDQQLMAAKEAELAARAAKEAFLSAAKGAIGVGTQALSGDVSGALGGAAALAGGPAGIIAAQIVQGIETIGQLGAKGVEEKLEEFQSNLLAGIKALPEIIGKVLPEFISELVPALITGLTEALPELLIAQVEAFARLIVAGFRDIPMAIAEGLTTAFLNIWDRIKEFFKDLFSLRLGKAFGGGEDGKGGLGRTLGKIGRVGAAIGTLGASELAIAVGKGVKNAVEGRSFARGGVVDRTGLAMVHAGERFTRQDGSMSGTTRAAMGAGGGGLVINLQGIMSKRDFVESIRRELGIRGSNLSLDPFTA